MITIVLVVIFGIIFSIFATQNTQVTNLYFWEYRLTEIPIYMIVLVSIGIGVFILGFYYFLHYLSVSMTIGDKNKKIKQYKKEIATLTKDIHELELENTKLKTKYDDQDFDENSL